ncbi:tetratricopeptide repeat protein [Herminiimonas arsenitoxidans]|uniref:tetratricopeptide repeat protein n=1 Tax=Herminiimonas arsenitoxidans TaxID=1809410 RepID=UPI0012FFC083|nr:tetratricopeptide repeat protein [Herminiimonas arsenitoxidans]
MSIINQMLQDLEQRHADGVAIGGMSGQVRAAPQEKKVHIAWLLAAILAVLLIGLLICLWLWPASLVKPVMAPQLSLKIAPGLTTSSTPIAMPEAIVTLTPTVPAVIDVVPVTIAPVVTDKAAADVSIEKNDDQKVSVKPVIASPVTVKPNLAKKQTDENIRSNVSVADSPSLSTSNKAALPETPLTLDKHVKELTPQQRAENDYRKATGLVQQGRVSEAIVLLEQALQADAQNAGARQTLIALLLSNKRQDEAARRAQEGLNLDSKQAGFAMILARLQVEKGDQQLAITTLQRTLPYAGDRPEYLAFLAAVLQREGRHKEAVEQYLSAVRRAPQNGLWWMGLGISLQADNRTPEAREAFTRARETGTLSAELQAFVDQKLKQLPR